MMGSPGDKKNESFINGTQQSSTTGKKGGHIAVLCFSN
jgi:hypothetical protein